MQLAVMREMEGMVWMGVRGQAPLRVMAVIRQAVEGPMAFGLKAIAVLVVKVVTVAAALVPQ